MICELDESDENWKLAIAIKEEANEKEGIKQPSPEALNIMLKEIQAELQKEKDQHQKEKDQWKNIQSQLSEYQNRLRETEYDLRYEKQHSENIRKEYEASKEYLTEERNKPEESSKEKKNLKEVLYELMKPDSSLAGRIAAGAVTGSGVTSIGGPVTAVIGGAAGGVVGGASYFWDKLTK